MQFKGPPYEAVLKASGEDHVAVCGQMRLEIVRVLTRKFRWEEHRVLADLDFLWQDAIQVTTIGRTTGVCRDPNDEFILECAELAGARCIVTGDKDLLSLGAYCEIAIMTARQYLTEPRKLGRI